MNEIRERGLNFRLFFDDAVPFLQQAEEKEQEIENTLSATPEAMRGEEEEEGDCYAVTHCVTVTVCVYVCGCMS